MFTNTKVSFSGPVYLMLENTTLTQSEGLITATCIAVVRLYVQVLVVWVLQLSLAFAGGGPETTLVVVNAASPISLSIANAYVQMRDIPENNVVWLDHVPAADSIDIKSFRTKIWKPIHEYIIANHLKEEIDTIAYSADFPYRVDFSNDLKVNKISRNRYLGHYASLTGLTFFGHWVERGDPTYLGLNRYYRRNLAPRLIPPRPLNNEEVKLIKDATTALKHKNYESAVESLQSLVKDYPWSGNVWYQLARGLAAVGRNDEAMSALSKAVKMGWDRSLTVRDDKLLKPLRDYTGFPALIRQMQLKSGPYQPAHGFRSQYIWTGRDQPVRQAADTDSPDRYYLSTLLAYTGLHGNSMPEVLSYLRAAVASDGTFPDGTVYLMENTDIRSQTRESSFHATALALRERGHRVEILAKGQHSQDGNIPKNKADVIGAVVGSRHFDWNRSNSRLLPGAIAESLTSYGGDFDKSSQTKLTEFLRYGAAGSSGTVAEPYSIQAKFPTPSLHIYYADGSSLAEAFYQSVKAPYQLIIVGDPLARPFAYFANVSLASPSITRAWHNTVLIKPALKPEKDHSIHHLELWIDGQYTDEVAPWDVFLWNTNKVEDGCHDVRLIAVEDSSIETRSYVHLHVKVNNRNHRVYIKALGGSVEMGKTIALSGSAPQARRVQIFQGTRLLGSSLVEDGRWMAAIPSHSLGLGGVLLYARAFYQDGSTARSCGTPVDIEAPRRLTPVHSVDISYQEGLRLLLQDEAGNIHKLVIKKLNGRLHEVSMDEKAVTSMHFYGEFKVEMPGFYQLFLNTKGLLRVMIDGLLKVDNQITSENKAIFLPLNLGNSWHSLRIDLVPEGQPFLQARLAGEVVTATLGGNRMRHALEP